MKQNPDIYILITADYELFLGRNFLNNNEILFTPTRRMIEICEELDVPITFFADICSVWAHRKYGLNEYGDSFERQMTQAIRSGHDVQLHLHPHWLNSEYIDNEWKISTDKMYLSELGFGTNADSATSVIKNGVDYLNQLLLKENPEYKCLAFRAAGLALQPEEEKLIEALVKQGIAIDLSIIKGAKLNLDTIVIDYTQVPTQANWHISSENGINHPAESGIFEIPILTFKTDLASRLGFLLRRLRAVGMRRGSGISRSTKQTRWSNMKTLLLYNLRYVFSNSYFSFSCDTKGYNLPMLLDGFDDYIERHRDSERIFVSMINHPKLLFEPQFQLLKSLVVELRKKYGEQIRFITATEAWKLI
ncbi:MAG: hypothetical protein ABIJ45_09770 [Candidatus Zixiibacteriota bacterium]